MNTDHDLLNRYLDGQLDAAGAERVAVRLKHDAVLQQQLERLQRVRAVLADARADSFGPYFAERVMRRLAPAVGAGGADSFYLALRAVFARTAVAGFVIAGVLAAYNMAVYGDLGVVSTIPEALLGLPSASLMDALTYSGF